MLVISIKNIHINQILIKLSNTILLKCKTIVSILNKNE